MSRQVFISNEEIQRAKQLRDQARSIADYRFEDIMELDNIFQRHLC